MEKINLILPEKVSKISANECISPENSELIDNKKHFESPLTVSTNHTLQHFQTCSSFSAKKNIQYKKKICPSKLEVLSLKNNNIKHTLENEVLKFTIKQNEEEIFQLKKKIANLIDENVKKDNAIIKVTDLLMKREIQFSELLENERTDFENQLKIRDHEEKLKTQPKIVKKTANKAIQEVMDHYLDEIILEKDKEIMRLQNLLENNDVNYNKEKSYLEERVNLLEEELEKISKTICKKEGENQFISHIGEISKLCNGIALLKHESLAILNQNADDIEFIDAYLINNTQISIADLHDYLMQALKDLDELKKNMALFM